MNDLDQKLNAAYPGKVVRKDLLHRIKKGTNVPTFVLEFLLARYCASDDPAEIDAGMEAVLATLQDNYVRPDESNKAQSYVQQHGKHRFIDKVHVTYKEREKRHWAEMENFNSRRIAIPEKFYRGIDRILEGGIWAEVLIAHNEVEDDDYAFYIEDLRPIQLSRFDFDAFVEARKQFTRDEWLDVIVRTIGLEPPKFSFRQKLHLLSRMIPFVEKNYNFIELGPRGTGKSYVFSEFSPYSTLVSGGQASTPTLFYNNNRRQVGMVGFWDIIAFDEVGGVKIKDPNTITIMKDYMANGRFSRGADVIADASFAFIGNIDHSIEQLVRSEKHDLFIALPQSFDLAIMDRFHTYLPGWEMPKNSTAFLTSGYGLITDYLAEAFHYVAKKTNRYDYVTNRCRFGKAVEGRDETGIKKTICGLLKILHPGDEPTREELDQYTEYALEGRRRVKEQMNKRKADDEFALIELSYFDSSEKEMVIGCPESKGAPATQHPNRMRRIDDPVDDRPILPDLFVTVPQAVESSAEPSVVEPVQPTAEPISEVKAPSPIEESAGPREKHFRIYYGDIGHSYQSIFGDYLTGAKKVEVEDPYIRLPHQISNFVRFCELLVRTGGIQELELVTSAENKAQQDEMWKKFATVADSLLDHGTKFAYRVNAQLHDRAVRLSNGWTIKIGRGFDFYQKPEDWLQIGSSDFDLRPCLETTVDIFRPPGYGIKGRVSV